jgi:hypothetical protein
MRGGVFWGDGDLGEGLFLIGGVSMYL